MNLVDSSGWVEFLTGGGNADFFGSPIRNAESLVVPTICLYEVFKRVLIELGEDRALEAMGIMSLGQIVDLDRKIAISAAQISVEMKLAMVDSIILATAREYAAILWTQEKHFEGMAGVKYRSKE